MKRFFSVAIFFGVVYIPLFAQNSAVVLSDFQANEVIDPSANQVNSFLIGLTASNPASLTAVVIHLEDSRTGEDKIESLSVIFEDNKTHLVVGEYEIFFENNRVEFFFPVRDQITAPYARIIISAYDSNGLPTNQLIYNSRR